MSSHMEFPGLEVAPNSAGGMIEGVKKGVIVALRTLFIGTSLTTDQSQVHVDMEYPASAETYPNIFVQFSTSVLRTSGIGHETITPEGNLTKQWYYEGRVSLTILALTSLERDRITDSVISSLAFQDTGIDPVTKESRSPMYASFAANPYVAIAVNADELRPGGQSVTVGTPWDPELLVYEDNIGFDIIGEFQSVADSTGLYRLSRIDVIPENVTPKGVPVPGEWM